MSGIQEVTWLLHIIHFNLLHSSALEGLIVGVVNEAFSNNPEKAELLVNRPSPTWGDLTPLGLAALAEDREFLGTRCCQFSIFRNWKRGFEASGLAIAFSTFTFLPVLTGWINFSDDAEVLYQQHRGNGRSRNLSAGTMDWYMPTTGAKGGGRVRLVLSPSATNFRRSSEPGARRVKSSRIRELRPQPSVDPSDRVVPGFTNFMVRKHSLRVRGERSRSTESEDFGVKCVRNIGWLDKLVAFYSAPVVKFTNHTVKIIGSTAINEIR